jgi:long-subunit acyl-CoA synthetase (AMP-forming)
MKILSEIFRHAARTPQMAAISEIAMDGSGRVQRVLTYAELVGCASGLCAMLSASLPPRARIGLALSNSIEWPVADLALALGRFIEVPVPLAFTAEQSAYLLGECELVLTDELGQRQLDAWSRQGDVQFPASHQLRIEELLLGATRTPPWTAPAADLVCKVIHTSGTTSRPKGVQIRAHGLDSLIDSLWTCVPRSDYQRYLSLVPFSLLIEQVSGLYLPLSAGGMVVLPAPEVAPLGTPGVYAVDRLPLIRSAKATALTLTPALAEALATRVRELETLDDDALLLELFGTPGAPCLAAGGAPVAPDVLTLLDSRGIQVLQGYGLSENSSVVSLNTRTHNRYGTVGRPLPHVQVKLADDSELLIKSASLFAGYLGTDPSSCELDGDGWLHTGDIATVDDEGYITIVGRKKNVIITANGRNISPEWVESRYRTLPHVTDVVVFCAGEMLQGMFLIDSESNLGIAREDIERYSQRHISGIERVVDPILVADSAAVRRRLFTVTGRPRRAEVQAFIELELSRGQA